MGERRDGEEKRTVRGMDGLGLGAWHTFCSTTITNQSAAERPCVQQRDVVRVLAWCLSGDPLTHTMSRRSISLTSPFCGWVLQARRTRCRVLSSQSRTQLIQKPSSKPRTRSTSCLVTLLPPAGRSRSGELEPSYGITYCTRCLQERRRGKVHVWEETQVAQKWERRDPDYSLESNKIKKGKKKRKLTVSIKKGPSRVHTENLLHSNNRFLNTSKSYLFKELFMFVHVCNISKIIWLVLFPILHEQISSVSM